MNTLQDAVRFLQAGDWQAAHRIVQEDESELAAWAHGIVHMLEGDMSNAGYWYRRAGRTLPDASAAATEIIELNAVVSSANE